MRFAFRSLPSASGGILNPRPVVDVWLEGLEVAPVTALVDSGALRTRFARELADVAGIDLTDSPSEQVNIGGIGTTGAMACVQLTMGAGPDALSWDCPIWFCDPWPFDFQLLGLQGFFEQFRVTLSAYREWLDCVPES